MKTKRKTASQMLCLLFNCVQKNHRTMCNHNEKPSKNTEAFSFVLYYKIVRYWLKIRSKKKTEFISEIEFGPLTIEGQIF